VTDGLPTISLVTPSLNQGRFLGDCIRSILDQDYPALDYAVVDGGSADESAHIARGFEDRLAWWVSEPDGGQYEAINKGFARSTGEIMGWLNADDMHLPWTLSIVGEIFARFPDVHWLTTRYPLVFDAAGRTILPGLTFVLSLNSKLAITGGELRTSGVWSCVCTSGQGAARDETIPRLSLLRKETIAPSGRSSWRLLRSG